MTAMLVSLGRLLVAVCHAGSSCGRSSGVPGEWADSDGCYVTMYSALTETRRDQLLPWILIVGACQVRWGHCYGLSPKPLGTHRDAQQGSLATLSER